MRYIATFQNARTTILSENRCRESGVKVSVIATPTNISTECGMALEMDLDNLQLFENLMEIYNIKYNIHERNDI